MKRLTLAAGLLATATLAACSGGSDAPPPPGNDLGNDSLPVEAPATNTAAPAPEPTPTPSPTPGIVVDNSSHEAQVQDDADAVGMTARLPQEGSEQPQEQPVDQAH